MDPQHPGELIAVRAEGAPGVIGITPEAELAVPAKCPVRLHPDITLRDNSISIRRDLSGVKYDEKTGVITHTKFSRMLMIHYC